MSFQEVVLKSRSRRSRLCRQVNYLLSKRRKVALAGWQLASDHLPTKSLQFSLEAWVRALEHRASSKGIRVMTYVCMYVFMYGNYALYFITDNKEPEPDQLNRDPKQYDKIPSSPSQPGSSKVSSFLHGMLLLLSTSKVVSDTFYLLYVTRGSK